MKFPNGPQTPAVLQMLRWIVNPMSFMEACTKSYGEIFTLRLDKNLPPLVIVSNPQAQQQILTTDTKELEAPGDLNKVFEPLLGKHSVISISGAEHQRQRQLLMPPFHGERMRNYSQVITDVTKQVISQYQIGKPFNIRSATQAITMRVIMQAVFGLHEGPRAEKLQQFLSDLLEKASSRLSVALLYFPALQRDFGPINFWGKQMRVQQEADKLIYEEIRERREQPDSSRTDILSLLMAARDEAGQPMTDEELRDELMTLLVAGHETTATALVWAFYWIHKIPSVRQKLLQELDSLGDNPDPGTVFKLPYLNAVCSETLRIYPVGMLTFPRKVRTPISLGGYELEPGTVLLGSIYLTHQREDIYPEPKQFKPERFLERQFSAYEYLPFGGGARRCIGLAFAQLEMKLALAKILSSLELELVDNGEIRPKRRGLVTGPDRPIQMIIKSQRQVKSPILQTTTV
ncbi:MULTISPECIES: cytochrome P450 [unclassified Nostoc]|uniref:cytochrome P450 n=1 Tax=unclassified Nostoc TaxID=2593658 RepID=UPI000CF34941|nr:cytochrome P450 [Nostoc sp. 'Peltigera membranacea cyanobiont' N6]AVH64476.1 cytochrome P450 [Nostoc sp. 'Peltigera membranacea cyanobiont' N6]